MSVAILRPPDAPHGRLPQQVWRLLLPEAIVASSGPRRRHRATASP